MKRKWRFALQPQRAQTVNEAGPNDLFEISSNNSPNIEDDDDTVIEPQDFTGDYPLESDGEDEE